MGLTTSPNGIRYPVGGDTASLLATYFKNLADDVQASLPVNSDTEPTKKPGLLWYAPTAGLLQITDGSAWYPLVGADVGQDIPLASGIVSNGVTPHISVLNNELYVVGNVKPSSGNFAAGATVTISTALPSTYRPPNTSTTIGKICAGNAANVANVFINASGVIIAVIGANAMSTINLDGLSGYRMT